MGLDHQVELTRGARTPQRSSAVPRGPCFGGAGAGADGSCGPMARQRSAPGAIKEPRAGFCLTSNSCLRRPTPSAPRTSPLSRKYRGLQEAAEVCGSRPAILDYRSGVRGESPKALGSPIVSRVQPSERLRGRNDWHVVRPACRSWAAGAKSSCRGRVSGVALVVGVERGPDGGSLTSSAEAGLVPHARAATAMTRRNRAGMQPLLTKHNADTCRVVAATATGHAPKRCDHVGLTSPGAGRAAVDRPGRMGRARQVAAGREPISRSSAGPGVGGCRWRRRRRDRRRRAWVGGNEWRGRCASWAATARRWQPALVERRVGGDRRQWSWRCRGRSFVRGGPAGARMRASRRTRRSPSNGAAQKTGALAADHLAHGVRRDEWRPRSSPRRAPPRPAEAAFECRRRSRPRGRSFRADREDIRRRLEGRAAEGGVGVPAPSPPRRPPRGRRGWPQARSAPGGRPPSKPQPPPAPRSAMADAVGGGEPEGRPAREHERVNRARRGGRGREDRSPACRARRP